MAGVLYYQSATIKEVNLSSLNTAGNIKVNVYDFIGESISKPVTLNPGTFKLEATCGNQTVTVNNKTYSFTGENVVQTINWTPPISWASQNTTGTRVTVVFKLKTSIVGSHGNHLENSKTVSIFIPTSVKPSTSMALSDTTGYLSKYGSYIRYKSKVKVQLTNTLSYNSPISSYNIKANGVTYTTNPATTDVLRTAGTNKITAYVTDKRGRSSNTVSKNITVLDYANPSVSFSVRRCNEDGTLNENGGYCKVTYSVSISSLSNKNSKTLKLSYKVSSESTTTDVTLSMPSYSVTNQNYIFQASDDKSYNVTLSATDDFITTTKSTVLSTAYTLIHFNESGKGLAIGKISEGDKFEVAMPAEFKNGINGIPDLKSALGNKLDKIGASNPITSTANDTVENWVNLGCGTFWFNKTGCLINQPSEYGFLQNFVQGHDVHQVFYVQTGGQMYHRGGNVYGWATSWRKMYDDVNLDIYQDSTSGTLSVGNQVQNAVVCSVTLKPGIYVVTGTVQFAANNSGYRTVTLSSDFNVNTFTATTMATAVGAPTRVQKTRVVESTTSVKFNLYAYHNAGATLSCNGCIEYVKIK